MTQIKEAVKKRLEKKYGKPLALKNYVQSNARWNADQQMYEFVDKFDEIELLYSSANNSFANFIVMANKAIEGTFYIDFSLDIDSLTKRGKRLYKQGFVDLLY